MSVISIPQPLERIASDPYWLRQFTVAEYHRMIETGILTPDDRVELLEGWIVNKMSQYPPHRSSVSRVVRRFSKILPDNWYMSVQGPLTLKDSEPEPDIMFARGDERTCDSRHPTPADLGVLIEVGDISVLGDRRYKGKRYAGEKVPEFWLINLVDRKIEVYTKPQAGQFRKKAEYFENDDVPFVLDRVTISDVPVSELMPKS